MMTASDVARHVGVNVRTVYRRVQDGSIPCYRIGRLIRFKQEEVEEALKGENNAKKASTRCRSNPAI